jgi:hypothetical protein
VLVLYHMCPCYVLKEDSHVWKVGLRALRPISLSIAVTIVRFTKCQTANYVCRRYVEDLQIQRQSSLSSGEIS